jgi:ubiquinone/menaquinone biosynthesis C-methylase UbiE
VSDQSRPDVIADAYSEHATEYDTEANQLSCWGKLAKVELGSLSIRSHRQCVVDVGCGTGAALVHLASRLQPSTRLIGVEPAPGMRALACQRTAALPSVSILDGRFEALPLADASVDHLYSIHAFHWVREIDRAIAELRRVLAPEADLDLFFVGQGTGKEFIAVTSPIVRRHLGLGPWLASARLRAHLTLEKAREVFGNGLPGHDIHVRESVETHLDTVDGHLAWWVRLEGHFADLEPAARSAFFGEVRQALEGLRTTAGIPYTTRILHVSTRRPSGAS